MPALANELARLIRPLHGSSPVARGRARPRPRGSSHELWRKNDQRSRERSAVTWRGLWRKELPKSTFGRTQSSPRPAAFVPSRGRDGGSRNVPYAATLLDRGARGERGGSGPFRTGPGSLLDAIPAARGARRRDGHRLRDGRPPDLQPRDDRRLPRQASGLRRPLRADGGHRLCGGLRHRRRALHPRRGVPDDSRRIPVRMVLRRRGRGGFGNARSGAASS